MGYRSEVAIAIATEKVEQFKQALNEDGRRLITDGEETQYEDCTVFYWSWVKWYDTYDDVESVQTAFSTIEDEYKEMLIIGEAYSDIGWDIESHTNGKDWLNYSSPQIVINGGGQCLE